VSLYILDTDHVSLFQYQHPLVTQRIYRTAPNEIAVTIVTLEEQLYGRLNRIRRAKTLEALVSAYGKLRTTWDFFNTINLLDFTEEAYAHYTNLIRQKIRIGTQDLRIAAIALSIEGIVVTRNQKDFGKVPDLRLQDWTIQVENSS
jgi:tRNA(fMet)-specific endonuclease VapC